MDAAISSNDVPGEQELAEVAQAFRAGHCIAYLPGGQVNQAELRVDLVRNLAKRIILLHLALCLCPQALPNGQMALGFPCGTSLTSQTGSCADASRSGAWFPCSPVTFQVST